MIVRSVKRSIHFLPRPRNLFKRGGCKIALANGTIHVVDEAVVVPEHAAEDTMNESIETLASIEWTLEKLKPMMNELIDIASASSASSRA